MGEPTPTEATAEQAADAAKAAGDDCPFSSTVSQQIESALSEALYMAEDSPVDHTEITLTPEQESRIASLATNGLLDALRDVTADDFDE